jgi:hypothetical protein
MIAPVRHILPITMIRRERVLPVAGKVLVRAGQKVGATDILAEAVLAPDYVLLDIARGLGMSLARADRYLHCQAGDQLTEKDIIAGPVGLARRVVRSPRDAKVILAGDGQVLLETAAKPYQLKAALPGEVVELIPDRGAVVETTGALIQGMWGNGGIEFGVLSVLAKTPDHVLLPAEIDVSLRGAVVLAGYCKDAEVFKVAEDMPLRALILASIDACLVPVATKCSVPVVILDGFGQCPMNAVAFKLLASNNRREIAVHAQHWDRHRGDRPELIIPLPAPGSVIAPPDIATFGLDQQVCILRAPFANEIGTIVALRENTTTLPDGLRTRVAEVRLGDGRSALVPLANLEVIV